MRLNDFIHLVGSDQFALSHPLDCNCYLLDGGTEMALIDTGVGLGADEILDNIASAGLTGRTLKTILITHSHLGHWGGASDIRARTGAKVLVNEEGIEKMADISEDPGIRLNIRFGRYPAGFTPQPCRADASFGDGDVLTIGQLRVQAIQVQGHTKDSTCFLVEANGLKALFTGDVVFYGGKIGLLNLEGCSFDDYRRDIGKLRGLGIDILLPGHGVFVMRRGQKHIDRAAHKLSDFVLPESFFETNELMWDREYLRMMTA